MKKFSAEELIFLDIIMNHSQSLLFLIILFSGANK